MTDKQIIIDGVDVSGCYELFNSCCCDNGSFYCSGQPNCQFKLEKRGYKLEQITEFTPREELIETITHLRVLNAELESYNEQLKESQDIEIKQNKNLREQLKRKEQECEAYKMEADEGKEINAELKAELTRANCQIADDEILQCDMREAIEELKAENDNIKETFDGLFKIQYKLADSNKKLRQCLTEIREIAESYNHYSAHAPVSGYSDILQKISECEGNDEM